MNGVEYNYKTYQGQELTKDLGLNTHEWKYRISDPSIGRFWQIDPLAEDYMYNSTYAFQWDFEFSGFPVQIPNLAKLTLRSEADSIRSTALLKPSELVFQCFGVPGRYTPGFGIDICL